MSILTPKPIHRSPLRMTLGRSYFRLKRWRHNNDVFPDAARKLPFASGATCAYNYVDLQLKNETTQPILLHVYLTDTHLVGEWRSTSPLLYHFQVYEAAHEICSSPGVATPGTTFCGGGPLIRRMSRWLISSSPRTMRS